MIHPQRIKILNEKPVHHRKFVVYWMQQSQRVSYNHALSYAIEQANELNIPLLVFFALANGFPDANLRHYRFMLDGLAITQQLLNERGIRMIIHKCDPATGLAKFANKNASLVVTDRGYLRIQRDWRNRAAQLLDCQLVQVETDVIVPLEVSSGKEEYAAVTIRSKLHKQLAEFFVDCPTPHVKKDSLTLEGTSLDLSDVEKLCATLEMDMSVLLVTWLEAGEVAAKEMLANFIHNKLRYFSDKRNDPSHNYLSNMSPYLHFGQISPYYIAKQIVDNGVAADSFLEELFVRRELSMNFVYYNKEYDSILCLPNWCRQTLLLHEKDKREYMYSLRQFEQAKTHDPYWNAAQQEMVFMGKMHGYMRMYWGKKILEWSSTPEKAFKTALFLNNKYSLDGRDANGFTGIAWCFGKHDRAWKERAIFGKIRFMNDKGLERKFDINGYVNRVAKEIKNGKIAV